MKRSTSMAVLVALAIGIATGTAAAQGQPEGEGLTVAIPDGWSLRQQHQGAAVDQFWYAPKFDERRDETRRQDFLVYQEIKQPPGLDVPQVLEGTINQALTNCPGLETGKAQSGLSNGYPAAFMVITCPQESDSQMGRVSLVLTIGGAKSVYQVQRIWRTPPFPSGSSPLVKAEIDSWVEFLSQLKVCDTRDPERHPCR